MTDKFRNKYRIPPARRPSWDYAWSANYFITICTKDRHHFFGNVLKGEMQLSEIGRIVESEWLKTSDIRSDMNIHLGAFVIMPNHFHAIVTIDDNEFNSGRDAMLGVSVPSENRIPEGSAIPEGDTRPQRDAKHGVSTDFKNAFIPQSKNLSSIVRGFKSAVTVQARSMRADFEWQTRFHDHIIRNSNSHQIIEYYILNNPINWMEDELFSVT